ncbi:MAG: hypothetical protein KAW12_05670 [Candidatus Aminicenantes bacterium]|nr:hypothetical protein [Candidatus Aminicenantes bacterium]
MKQKNENKKHELDDERIVALVGAVKYKIPQPVEERLNRAIAGWEQEKKTVRRRSFSWYPVAAALAAVFILVAALFVIRPFAGGSAAPPPITEIRTEFELKDKNIKIIWFQKKDFKLRRKKS